MTPDHEYKLKRMVLMKVSKLEIGDPRPRTVMKCRRFQTPRLLISKSATLGFDVHSAQFN